MASERQVSIVETRSVTSNFLDSTQEAKALDAAITGVVESSKTLTQSEINLQGALDRMDAKYNEATRSANELARAQDLIARARKQGVGDEEQYGRILAGVAERQAGAAQRAAGSMRQLSTAANENSKNFGLASHQIQNLGFQLNDLIVQIGSGGGIFRPLLQQGAQVQQILSMSEGGVAGVLSRVADKMKAIGPAALIGWGAAATTIGAVVAATGLAIKATIDYQDEMAKTNRILTKGPGLASGIKAGDVQDAGEQAAAQGGIAAPDARNVALEYAKLGSIGAKVMKDLTKLTEPFARTFGIEMPQAVKELGDAFDDPAGGIAKLANRLGVLDGAQVQHIQTIARVQGAHAAQVEMLKAVSSGVIKYGDDISTARRLTKEFSDGVVGDFDRLQKAVAAGLGFGPAIERQLKVLEQKVEGLKALQAEIDAGGSTGRRAEKVAGPTMSDDFSSAFAEGERLRREQEENASRSAQASFDKISRAAFETARSLDPIGQKFDELAAKALKLQKGLEIPDQGADLTLLTDGLQRVTDAMGGATTAAGMRAAATERQAEVDQLAIAAIYATDQAERARIAGRQAELALTGQGTTEIQRNTAARTASNLVIAASNVAADRQIVLGAQQAAMQQAQLQVQLAENEGERAAAVLRQARLAEEQTLLNLLDQGVAPRRAIVIAEQAMAAVLAQESAQRALAVQQGERQIAQGRLQLQVIGAVTVAQKAQLAAQQAMLQTEGSLLTMTQRLTLAEQARQQVIQQAAATLQSMLSAQRDQIRMLELEISSLGMNEAQRNKLIAVMQAENELRRMGIDLLSKEGQEYIANARKAAELAQRLEDLREKQERAAEATRKAAAAWNTYNAAASQASVTTSKFKSPSMSSGSTRGTGSGPTGEGAGYNLPYEGVSWASLQDLADFKLKSLTMTNMQLGKMTEKDAIKEATRQMLAFPMTPYGSYETVLDKSVLEEKVEDVVAPLETLATAAETAASKLGSVADLGRPIEDSIDTLRGLQEAALSRVYRPDPYMEKNPEYFYTGEKIMKEGQDRIFDGLQTQIEKLQSLQASLGTLVQQNSQLPQTLVDALIAAGFSNIAEKIVAAFTPTSAPSATPNPTAVQGKSFGNVNTNDQTLMGPTGWT